MTYQTNRARAGRNNIKIQMFKIQNKNGSRIGVFCFGHWYLDHLNLFGVSKFGFRISPSLTGGLIVFRFKTFQLAFIRGRIYETGY